MQLPYPLISIAIVGVAHVSMASASPTVIGQQISWPDDGWYQVQEATTYRSICQGGSNCDVDPGTYIVINHSTGERFEGVTVTESGSTPVTEPTVSGSTISWPDDGWYQVQDASSYASLCQGGLSCTVPAGTYNVINLTTGARFESVVVAEDPADGPGDGPVTDPDDGIPSSPAHASISIYSDTMAEVFWDRPAASERVTLTEVWRDGEFIGSTGGTSYFDDTRTEGTAHWYEFFAVDADGDRSPASTLDVLRADQTLQPENPTVSASYEQAIAFEGDTAVIGIDEETPSVQILTRDTSTGDWEASQQLFPQGNIYGESFGSSVALSEDTLIVRGLNVDQDSFLVHMLYIYSRDDSGVWNEIQHLKVNVQAETDGFALDGDTLAINLLDGIELYERNPSSGQWEFAQLIEYTYGHPDSYSGNLALDGDRLLTGTNKFEQDGDLVGAAFLYRKTEGSWELEQQLIPEAASEDNLAASSIAIDGDTIAVSLRSGNIAIFKLGDNGIWSEVTEVTGFGTYYYTSDSPSLRIEGDLLVAGFDYAHGLARDSGQVTIYEQNSSGNWEVKTRLVAPQGVYEFGTIVRIDNGEAFVSGKDILFDNDSYHGLPQGFLFDLQ